MAVQDTVSTPVLLEEVLGAEYAALRPELDFKTSDRAELYGRAHAQEKPFSALCLSGGGIRSATFALGAIQGLAEQGLLEQFDYLSTVSGGGYIGGWLTAWSNRRNGLHNVVPQLRRNAPAPGPEDADPIQHLREYNNYLTPKLGAFSGDTWTMAAIVIRNVFLNWLVLIPLLMSALMAPRIAMSLFHHAQISGSAEVMRISALVVYGLPLLATVLFTYSMFMTLRYLPGVGNKDHTGADFMLHVLAPLALAAITFCAYDALHFLDDDVEPGYLEMLLWMSVPCAAGWLLYLATCGKSFRMRLKLLASQLSIAIVLLGIGTGSAAWLLAHFLADQSWPVYTTLGPTLLLLGFAVSGALFVGLSSMSLHDEDREWLSRAAARLLLFCLFWTAACSLVLVVPAWVLNWNAWSEGAMGSAGAIAAWASALTGFKGSYQKPGQSESKPKTSLAAVVLKVAPALFAILLIIGLAILTDVLLAFLGKQPLTQWLHQDTMNHIYWHQNLAVALTFFLLSWVMARYININVFSLEGMYRNRLIRAYLGASNPKRAANKFTGFSETDNYQMHKLDPSLRPFHVLNLTLNLVNGDRLAWQQRKAESFTVTPLHCGNNDLGYRGSASYGGKDGISLGTAVTISGAAASPNMGYHSSPLIGLIMTLFNVRLGSWKGNPGKAGAKTFGDPGPRSAIGSLVQEAFGLTSDKSEYVYLSDGGHFENLGIYEMVRRRCHTIVALDAGCDEVFGYEDLGNALRKIRIDLKIPITFHGDVNIPSKEPEKRCCTATIHYSAVDGLGVPDGELIYIKPVMLGNEPPDVTSYRTAHPSFPHQSTAEQWFDESQTESYRMLGLHTIDDIFAGWKAGDVCGVRQHIETQYLGVALPAGKAQAAIAGARD